MSRRGRPKQLLPFIGGRSLLELAAGRLEGVVSAEHRLICASESHRGVIRGACGEYGDDQILGEPVGRDTVNAVGFTAAVLSKRDRDAVFAVLTADHIIEPHEEFARKLEVGFRLVEDDGRRFVTFAIEPTYAATGYGYVEMGPPIEGFAGARRVLRFVEKPDVETARTYLRTGTFGWNSGMFVFHAGQFMEALSWYQPECYAGLTKIATLWDTGERGAVLEETYPKLPRISVDYGVMEPASADERLALCGVPMEVTWLDVGNWPNYASTLEADAEGCRTNAKSLHVDSSGILALSDNPEHVIATIGCKDLIVVHTEDVTMVCPASEAQRVKALAKRAAESLR